MTVFSLFMPLFKRLFPFLEWLPELKNLSILKSDITAGLSVVMLSIPTAMAYAHLAGLPVCMGLYAAFIPTIIAALFGSSRSLSTGPVPVTSLLTAVALQPLAASGTSNYIEYALLLSFMAGLFQFGLGILRFGIVVNFISYPVILGFVNGIALIIASMQLGNIFGVYAITAPHYYETILQVIQDSIRNPHWPTVGIAAIAFTILLAGKKWAPKWPMTLIAVIITTLLAWQTNYETLKPIRPGQIINAQVQKLLSENAHYPTQMQGLVSELSAAKKKLSIAIKTDGPNSETADLAISQVTLSNLRLNTAINTHNFSLSVLNRMYFRRVLTPEGIEIYVPETEALPEGLIDNDAWRIARILPDKKIVLQSGGAVVGDIPSGLPTFTPFYWSWDLVSSLFMSALVIALVGFTEAITIAKRVATESRQRIDVNQELIGQGLAKCAGAFFQSMPVSGGFTRSIVNYHAGAKTGFSSVISGLVVMIILLWLTPLFYYLPYATLAAVIMVGVVTLLDIKEFRRIFQVNRREGLVALGTLFLTVALAPRVANAIALGVVLSLGVTLYETMRPKIRILTQSEAGDLVEVEDGTKQNPYFSIIRFYGSLFFVDAAYFEEQILKLITAKPRLKFIILDCSRINKIDTTGAEAIRNIGFYLEEAGITLYFTRVRSSVLEVLHAANILNQDFATRVYKDNEEAIAHTQSNTNAYLQG